MPDLPSVFYQGYCSSLNSVFEKRRIVTIQALSLAQDLSAYTPECKTADQPRVGAFLSASVSTHCEKQTGLSQQQLADLSDSPNEPRPIGNASRSRCVLT